MIRGKGTPRLTARFVETVKSGPRTRLYCDGGGLYLCVQPTGSKQWKLRTVIRGRRRDIGLGGFPLVSLVEARETAFEARKEARAGGDPLAARRAQRVPTFEEAANAVISLRRAGWSNPRSEEQWRNSLAEYVFPRLGARQVTEIDTADVMAVLGPIWTAKPVTAKRVRQRIDAVMRWAVAQGHRTDNPAAGAVAEALPKHGSGGKRHYCALPYAEVADAIGTVRASDVETVAKLAFEFLILTAARSGEVRGARWSEIDMDVAMWIVPAERMKADREHRVPLSGRALAILDEARTLGDGTGLIFPGTRAGKPMAERRLWAVVRGLGIDATTHGFRASFRDWAAECTNTPHAVMEAALAHKVRDQAEAAYARSDLVDKRRDLMTRWATYLADGTGKVVPLKRA